MNTLKSLGLVLALGLVGLEGISEARAIALPFESQETRQMKPDYKESNEFNSSIYGLGVGAAISLTAAYYFLMKKQH